MTLFTQAQFEQLKANYPDIAYGLGMGMPEIDFVRLYEARVHGRIVT